MTAVIWIQLHHVLIELWKGEILEVIASHFGRVLQIDEHTLSLSRSKFARICVEIDLDLALQKGTWVKYGENYVFIIALYEKLPVFCFNCGRVGHGDSNCTFTSSRKMASDLQPPTISIEREMKVDDHCQAPGEATKRMFPSSLVENLAQDPPLSPDDDSRNFGAWLKPCSRRNSNRGRGRSGARFISSGHHSGDDGQDPNTCLNSLEPLSSFLTSGGAATVHFSSNSAFLHLMKNKNPIESFPAVDEGTSHHPDAGDSSLSLGPKKSTTMGGPVDPPFHCSDLTLALVSARPRVLGIPSTPSDIGTSIAPLLPFTLFHPTSSPDSIFSLVTNSTPTPLLSSLWRY